MIRPAEHEVLAAVLEAFTTADKLAGDGVIRDWVDSDAFVHGSVIGRIAVLARIGAHYACVEKPARQTELLEVSHQVCEAFNERRGRWLPVHRVLPERAPTRCDECHDRLEVQAGEAA